MRASVPSVKTMVLGFFFSPSISLPNITAFLHDQRAALSRHEILPIQYTPLFCASQGIKQKSLQFFQLFSAHLGYTTAKRLDENPKNRYDVFVTICNFFGFYSQRSFFMAQGKHCKKANCSPKYPSVRSLLNMVLAWFRSIPAVLSVLRERPRVFLHRKGW